MNAETGPCTGCWEVDVTTCLSCGRAYCPTHDATVGDPGFCPGCADPLAPLDTWRAAAEKRTA